jgi:uncharacterized protein with HEPN domain
LSWTAKVAGDEYARSQSLQAAVEREFIVIGEALRVALLTETKLATVITDAPNIVGFRNVLVHSYWRVNSDEVWTVVQADLPLLLSECRSLLGELPA